MDPTDSLSVRFHFNGEFVTDEKIIHYVGGKEAVSILDRANLSLQAIRHSLSEHYLTVQGQQLHWLFPGKEMFDGLLMLYEEKSVDTMCACTTDGGVADIFVEDPPVVDEEASHWEDERYEESQDQHVDVDDTNEAAAQSDKSATRKQAHDASSSNDSDFMPSDCSSDDDEADAIRQDYKKFKKSKRMADDRLAIDYEFEVLNEVKPEGKYKDDSSEEDVDSYDEDSDGKLVRLESNYARFNSIAEVISFTLGMTFTGKKQFKDAIINYALAQRKEIKFIKDEGDRVRAKCTWPHCPWVCLCRKTSKFESWQITSYVEEHTCPKRRDSSLVTSTRIAKRFESLIKSSPEWSIQQLRATVQEEMFANVHISKVKRAKAIVIAQMLADKEGEYSQVFDYQQELLRSNPGTTCVVKLNPDFEEPTFYRFYVCFDACKKGFLAGCRKVIGLDGCFLKGRGGEILNAVGRDANHQMYPIAWALVDKETNESWDWFCSLLFNDLKIGDGEGWVIISDQQKGILNAVHHWTPMAEHRNCARHIYANWRKKYREKDWQKMFWACAKAPYPMLFNLARAKLAQCTPEGARDVMNTDPHHWQLSGLPCSHAISCIYCTTNCLDDYIADCYKVESFKRTYAYCLQPLEGRDAWPVSTRPKPVAPGEISMPGRKKKSRTREQQEKPKTSKHCKVGTIIKCSLCKLSGHNKSTCKLRHGIASASFSANVNAGPSASANAGPSASANAGRSASANPPAYAPCHVPAMGSQQSTAKRGKRKATSDLGAKNVKKRATNAGSQGTRSYTTSGNTINVHPLVQGSQASSSVTINVSSGTTTARSTSNGTGTGKKKYERLRNLLGFEK